MCNAAEQASADYSSDPQGNNVLVSAMEDLVICGDTSTRISEQSSKAIANHSDVAAVAMPIPSSRKANGVHGHRSYHAEEMAVPLSDSQEIAEELVVQNGECSKACLAMAASFSEGNGTDKNGTLMPSIHVRNFSKTSGCVCDPDLVEPEDDVHRMSDEYREVETKPREIAALLENQSSKETESQIEGEKFQKESLQETSKELVKGLETSGCQPDRADRNFLTKAVETWSYTPISSGSQQSVANPAKKLSIDPCEGAEITKMQPNMVHTDRILNVDECPALEESGVGSAGHSPEPCLERENFKAENSSDIKLNANKKVLIDFDDPLACNEMKSSVRERTAANAEEGTSGAMLSAPNVEEMESEAAAKQHKQMRQNVVSHVHVETWIPMAVMSSEEDAAEDVLRSFKEANQEIQGEIEQEEGTIASSDCIHSKGPSRPELAEFFSNARGSEPEKEIEEQESAPVTAKVPLKKKLFMESPRSLRMLLFSEETTLSSKKDEKPKKDGKPMELSSKVVPAKESRTNENRTEHNYPAKWYEGSDNEEASSSLSGPMAFSGALMHQGVIAYSGQIPYSGSTSHRSDSSTSTRSFAFPILASEWNSSPVRMGPPDPRFHRRPRRKWHFCFCCRRPSSWFD